jgi:hypothetical protein
MAENPYAPPKAGVADAKSVAVEVPRVALLYTVNQIATATFLGTVLAGGWMMAANYRAMGLEDKSRVTIGWSIGGFIVLAAMLMLVPELTVGMTIITAVVCAIGFRAWAETRFGKTVEKHLADGGTEYNWWRVVGLGLLCLAMLFAVAAILEILLGIFDIRLE